MTTTFTRYVPPVLHVHPLTEIDGWDDGADFSELACAPVFGAKVSDYDCCSTEAWVVVGPALDSDTVLVESIEATQHFYNGPIVWQVIDSLDAPSLADAVAATLELAHYPYLGRRGCRCD